MLILGLPGFRGKVPKVRVSGFEDPVCVSFLTILMGAISPSRSPKLCELYLVLVEQGFIRIL